MKDIAFIILLASVAKLLKLWEISEKAIGDLSKTERIVFDVIIFLCIFFIFAHLIYLASNIKIGRNELRYKSLNRKTWSE